MRKCHTSTLTEFLKMIWSVISSESSQRNKAAKPKMPYVSGVKSRFLSSYISRTPVRSSRIPPYATSPELSVKTFFLFYSRVDRTLFRVVFPYVLLDGTIHSVCDVLSPLLGPPPTGAFWSSLLFCLYPAKHSTVP